MIDSMNENMPPSLRSGGKGEFEKEPPSRMASSFYTENDVLRVREAVFRGHRDAVAVVNYVARDNPGFTGVTLGMMCRDGYFGRDGDQIFPLNQGAPA
jgi:hypothetical protein